MMIILNTCQIRNMFSNRDLEEQVLEIKRDNGNNSIKEEQNI